MKHPILFTLLLPCLFCNAQIKDKWIIDSVHRLNDNNVEVLHDGGNGFYYSAIYRTRGLEKANVIPGDSCIIHEGNKRTRYLPFVTIKRKL